VPRRRPRTSVGTRRRLAATRVAGAPVELVSDGERLALEGSAGRNEVTKAEAEQIARHADDLEPAAAARGLSLDDRTGASHLAQQLRAQVRPDELAVLIDTTILHNAEEALRGDTEPTAVALLDLSVLTVAAACFDTILVQPDLHPPHSDIADLTRVLRLDVRGEHELAGMYSQACHAVKDKSEMRRLKQGWGNALGVAPSALSFDFRSVETLETEKLLGYWTSRWLGSVLTAQERGRKPDPDLDVALALHTVRAAFNDRVAAALQVPYLSSSFRLPVTALLANRKTELLRVLTELLAATAPVGSPAPVSMTRRARFTAPLLLGVLLKRMSVPGDYRGALDDLRSDLAGLRERLRNDLEGAAWNDDPGQYLRRFAKHMPGAPGLAEAERTVNATAQAGVTFATAGADPGLLGALLKAIVTTQPAKLAHRTYLRVWRPEIYIFISLAKQAKELGLLERRVEKIWRIAPDDEFERQLTRFAGFGDPFSAPLRNI
jgi:hypothetical protein